jgi:hypothetical protein
LSGNTQGQKAKNCGHNISRKNNPLLVEAYDTRNEHPRTGTPNPSTGIPLSPATLTAKSFYRPKIENENHR